MMLRLDIFLIISVAIGQGLAETGFTIGLSTDGTYYLSVNGNKWLTSGDTFFLSQGRKYSMSDNSLTLVNTSSTSGTDKVGQWQNIQFFYYAGSQPVLATIKTYNVPNLPLAIFSQDEGLSTVRLKLTQSPDISPEMKCALLSVTKYTYLVSRHISRNEMSALLSATKYTYLVSRHISRNEMIALLSATKYMYLVSRHISRNEMSALLSVTKFHTYLQNWTGTSAQDPQYVISGFPTFKTGPASGVDLGYLGYGSDFSGYSGLDIGRWSMTSYFETGTGGGPLVIFDNSSNAMVVSPLSQFMATSNNVSFMQQQVSYGILGLVDTVPAGFQVDFIVYFSDRGINQAVTEWGQFLQFYYDKLPYRRISSLTLNYMGYWTDNGAYYYYHTEDGKNYQTTMLDAVSYIKNLSLPFQYLQYDSWWYPKGHRQGAVTWTPLKDVLPGGFQYLASQTQLPFGCHNRYWDSETTYARYNGGQYNFVQDKTFGLSVPDDQKFWDDLFNTTKQWGNFILYEQDWLNWETDQNVAMLTDVHLGRRWLTQMGLGAQKFTDIEIQYCMAYSRHILQSLEIDTVTQARASHDYQPGGRQWDIGITSMFVHAVGLAPSKDTFWTSERQPGSPYGHNVEKFARLNSLIATLSTGPYGPGDGIGFINVTLLMRCCDNSGRILQPDRPAMAINDQIQKKAFSSYTGPMGEVYTTYSNFSGHIFSIILAADMYNEYSLTPSSGWTAGLLPPSVVYSGTDWSQLPVPFSDDAPLTLGLGCTTQDFCLYYTSPVLRLGDGSKVILLGERDKWVPFSYRRFYDMQLTTNDVIVRLNVNARESVTFYFQVNDGAIENIVCDNSQRSSHPYYALVSVLNRTCTFVAK
ncbi:hypothetical protein Btru_072292 [Bulinus truncatus]|nr:hypothetical protein Btru_072292 [Bulinus truncatus]